MSGSPSHFSSLDVLTKFQYPIGTGILYGILCGLFIVFLFAL
jgi:tetrahydromethanopterin S-methyltransferase subunit G